MEDIDGERRYVRHVKFTGPKGEDIEARLIYDYRRSVFCRFPTRTYLPYSVGPTEN